MSTTLLSDIIKKRQSEGLPVDDASMQRVRDQYMEALRSGQTQTTLLDDTAEEGITWVPKQYDNGRIDWYPSEEPLKEDFIAQDFLAGISANTMAKPSEGGSPFSKLAGLAAMMAGAGKVGGLYKGGRLAGRMAAHGAALGGYSGVGTAMTGGDAGDVLKAAGSGAAIGAGLTGIAASPLGRGVLTSAPGEAALWAGLEAAHNPDASVAELAGAAGMGMLASRLAGTPYRTRYEPLDGAPTSGPAAPQSVVDRIFRRRTARDAAREQAALRMIEEAKGLVPAKRSELVGPESSPDAAANKRIAFRRPANDLSRKRAGVAAYEESAMANRPVDPAANFDPETQVVEGGRNVFRVLTPQEQAEAYVAADVRRKYDRRAVGPESGPDANVPAKRYGLSTIRDIRGPVERPAAPAPGYTDQTSPLAVSPGAYAPSPMSKTEDPLPRSLDPETLVSLGEPSPPPPPAPLIGVQPKDPNDPTGELEASRATDPYAGRVDDQWSRTNEAGSDYYLGFGLGGAQGLMSVELAGTPEYQPTPGNGVSEAAAAYNKTGDVRQAAQIAARGTQRHALVPSGAGYRAVPSGSSSGLSVSYGEMDPKGYDLPAELLEFIPEASDAGAGWFSVAGRRAEGNISGGKISTPVFTHIEAPQRETEMARARYMDTESKNPRDMIKGLSRRQREEITSRMEDPASANDLDVRAWRAWFDKVVEDVNVARRARGDREVNIINDYVPHIQKYSLMSELLGGDPAAAARPFGTSDEFFNPMAQHRTGGTKNREMDIAVLAEAYLSAAARDIFNSPVIKMRNEFSRALRDAGKNQSANMVDEITDRIWRDIPHHRVQRLKEYPRAVRSAAAVGRLARRRLNEAALVGNAVFTTAIQPLSISNTIAMYGWRNTAAGMMSVFNKDFRKYAFEELRGGTEKAGGVGLVQQDHGSGTAISHRNRIAPAGKYDLTLSVMNIISKELEKNLYLASAAAAGLHATKNVGMTDPNQIKQHMDDGGNITQGAYYRADQLGWQHDPNATTLLPFLTYLFNTGNSFAEAIASPAVHAATGKSMGILKDEAFVGKTRFRSAMLSAKRLASYMIAMLFLEETLSRPLGRRPFRDIFFGKEASPVMPLKQMDDFAKAVTHAMKYNDSSKLMDFADRYYLAGGAQRKRFRDTLKAIDNGGWVTRSELRNGVVTERRLFNIKGDELKSFMAGPYAAEEGQKYADKHFDGPPFYEMFRQMDESYFSDEDSGKGTAPLGGRPLNIRRAPARRR